MRVLERLRPLVKPGDQVHINFPADRLLLFRKEDGMAI